MTKVTTLLTENMEALIPDLPKLRGNVAKLQAESSEMFDKNIKTNVIAEMGRDGVEELKQEFEYMKTRFSPQFVARVDKALGNLNGMQYDIEVMKMTTAHAAMKKDLDVIE